jgi:hypothetical protein
MRSPGYYWVRFYNSTIAHIDYWTGTPWVASGQHLDYDFDFISRKRLKPPMFMPAKE